MSPFEVPTHTSGDSSDNEEPDIGLQTALQLSMQELAVSDAGDASCPVSPHASDALDPASASFGWQQPCQQHSSSNQNDARVASGSPVSSKSRQRSQRQDPSQQAHQHSHSIAADEDDADLQAAIAASLESAALSAAQRADEDNNTLTANVVDAAKQEAGGNDHTETSAT